jgi:hypothetical protein
MTRKLRIAADLTLPGEFVTQAAAVIAKRRAGKSYISRRIAEQLLAVGQQVVIVDPKGDWWGIRTNAAGDGPGYPVIILGGEHGDLPLNVDKGEIVAQMVVEDRASILLDLSVFRKHEVATFMTAFLETLYRLKAKEANRTAVMLIIDEADAIAPQKPNAGEERMLGAAEDIVRRGGQRGIGCMMITQRTAVLNKNVLTQCEVLVALRTIAPQDLKAMQAWIDVHGTDEERKELMSSLPSLPVGKGGKAWFWSPGWPTSSGIFQKVEVLPIETYDSGRTPGPGEKAKAPRYDATSVDLKVLEKRMADAIEQQRANDPTVLRKEIASLKKQLASASRAPAVDASGLREKIDAGVERELASFEKEERRRMGLTATELRKVASLFEGGMVRLRDVADQMEKVAHSDDSPLIPRKPLPVRQPMTRIDARNRTAHGKDMVVSNVALGSAAVSGVGQRILNTIAGLADLGVGDPDKATVAALVGYHPNAKSYANAMGALNSSGFVQYLSGGRVTLTGEGQARAESKLAINSLDELHKLWFDRLGGVAEKILTPLINDYPSEASADAVAESAGYHPNAKSFANAKGRLRTLGLIEYPKPGYIRATKVLFPEGLV